MSANIDQQAQEDFIKCWNGFKPYEKPVYQEFKDGFLCGHQAATSRQEAKIKALRDSLTWALSNISEEHYGWPSDEDAAAHNAAIAAAKE